MQCLEHVRLPANKALGQHFLRNESAISRIVQVVAAGASVLEIGPGAGAITVPLHARVGALTLIEKDDRFAKHWQQYCDLSPHFNVIHGDVLRCLHDAVATHNPQWIVGNLPYNISGPLTALMSSLLLSGGMVLMYQREVGERILADPGSKTYGGLSVLVRHHYMPSRLLSLPPGAFSPPPKVHSVVLRFLPHGRTPPCSWDVLQRCVRIGFAHRRKTLRNNFRNILTAQDITALDIDPGCRGEQLPYSSWTRLANAVEKRGQRVKGLT
ncbi:MAG: 16S rRNA (adenine(1518)-N(6)/adenine(1519)-N(6))-dimethyltransferase RsmA [Mariprofundaceae bacterium]|nr:16S rRNA (adenine(1518)-N(6)/adenine(1519)-N(6))-dimethyltransferase RsmA [Mariprofundaceae bacterium]